jgi:hypothetical protein
MKFAVVFRTSAGHLMWLSRYNDWNRHERNKFPFVSKESALRAIQQDEPFNPSQVIVEGEPKEKLSYGLVEMLEPTSEAKAPTEAEKSDIDDFLSDFCPDV